MKQVTTTQTIAASSGKRSLGHLLEIHKIINMVANCHEEIKEQFAANLHLHLHGAAALEGFPASDDQSQVMSAEARVTVRRVLVGIACTAQDGTDLDSTLQPLFAQGKPLELLEAISIRRTIHCRVSENNVTNTGMKDGRLDTTATADFRALQLPLKHPGIVALVVHQARIVVTLV